VVKPPGVGRRRMFAGGRLRVDGPLRVGEVATRSSRVVSTVDKPGRTGLLTFVTVAHEISQRDQVVVVDEQDLVYRDATAAPLVIGEPAPDIEMMEGEREVPIDPVLLFRFSALTYNGHRIHYDRDYARDVEGYPGLVVHGPLQAILMAEAARGRGASTGTFEYRLVSPLFDHQGLVVSATQVRDRSGRVTASGKLAGFGRP
jgi:3-methylfumaryl-CoA hydratase